VLLLALLGRRRNRCARIAPRLRTG
jgi:hypothetical protein